MTNSEKPDDLVEWFLADEYKTKIITKTYKKLEEKDAAVKELLNRVPKGDYLVGYIRTLEE